MGQHRLRRFVLVSVGQARRVHVVKAEVGLRYRLDGYVNAAAASYSINGEPYATATYEPGAVPATGYFGFAVYHREDLLVEDIRITPL
jgi:hypothetical protein